jgi:coenzyme F420 hydrogenase subunit beta
VTTLPLVVDGGCCVGCGACAVAAPDALTMRVGPLGTYEVTGKDGRPLAEVDAELPEDLGAVCPFSPTSSNEDELSERLYPGLPHHAAIGRHDTIVAGHVTEADFRERGTSGGMTSWVVHELLRKGEVDGVVHVASHLDDAGEAPTYSQYTISRTVDELLANRKSRYHVQTLEGVFATVRAEPGRYAVIGVPCFIKAVRLLTEHDPVLAERVTFTAALFCGHLKTSLFSQYLAWSTGVQPGALVDIDYRHKLPDRPANRYAVRVDAADGTTAVTGAERIHLADWGIGLFKLGACDYCDDVVGETADISCGDAWLPPFMSDWRGANVAIARSPRAAALVAEGRASGALEVVDWTPDQVAASQAAGLRHRRNGLAVRLANRRNQGRWAPTKRVAPDDEALHTRFGDMILLREEIALTSSPAFLRALKQGDLSSFTKTMAPLVRRYHGSRSTTAVRRMGAWVLYRLPVSAERLVRKLTGGRRFT